MENKETITDLLEKIQAEELDFLPPDENVKKGFMTFIKFIMFAS